MSRSRTPRNASRKCRKCGECRPDALTRCGLCYECVLIRDGRKPTELSHPFGRDNPVVAGITVEIPGNWHRAFDARREARPENLKRPGDNPLQQVAAIVATLGEAAEVIGSFSRNRDWPEWIGELADLFARAASSAAEWLLILVGKLDEWHGPGWFDEMPEWRL